MMGEMIMYPSVMIVSSDDWGNTVPHETFLIVYLRLYTLRGVLPRRTSLT